ncbi:hypothetical protein KGV55_03685, partial [Candidatus Gracilibacteria bacterium]|nr:hypothetical protein [Candidatus Gracilibacteria bacterium]
FFHHQRFWYFWLQKYRGMEDEVFEKEKKLVYWLDSGSSPEGHILFFTQIPACAGMTSAQFFIKILLSYVKNLGRNLLFWGK